MQEALIAPETPPKSMAAELARRRRGADDRNWRDPLADVGPAGTAPTRTPVNI